MNPAQAIQFVKKHGIVLESAHGSVPNLAETVAGERIRGSWWAHPKSQSIFRLTRAVRDSDDILVCRLMHGKVTYVHRRLWSAIARLARQFGNRNLDRIREVHTSRGEHELQIVAFPRWVPEKIKLSARKMSEAKAVSQLGNWYLQNRVAGQPIAPAKPPLRLAVRKDGGQVRTRYTRENCKQRSG
jgi:hypothetical protein